MTTDQHAIKHGHHPAGPSSLGRILRCHGSRAMVEKARAGGWKSSLDSDAERGTRIHGAVADILTGTPIDYELADDESEAAEACADFADEMVKRHGGSGPEYVEQLVELRDGDEMINYGTADYIALCRDGTLLVIDWKTGRNVDRLSLVLQLVNYAAAAFEMVDSTGAGRADRVDAWAYYPATGERFRWDADLNDPVVLLDAVDRIRAVVQTDDDALTAGEHCKRCDAQGGCPATRQVVQREADALIHGDQVRMPAVEECGERLRWCKDVALPAIKALESYVREQERLRPGSTGGQYRLVEMGGTRKVVDERALIKALGRHLSAESIEEARKSTLNVPVLERAFVGRMKAHDGMGAGEAKALFSLVTDGMIEQPKVHKLMKEKS